MSHLLTITNAIVLLTVLVSMMLMDDRRRKADWLFLPVVISQHNQWYRFLSSGLIHADGMHLFINMFVLWSFGNALEQSYFPAYLEGGVSFKFLLLYLSGIVIASIPSYLRHKNDPSYAALGASGGVSAVVFAVILFAPWQNLYLYGVIAIPQILAGIAYLVYSWMKDKKANDSIGHLAHFSGAVWGLVFPCLMEPKLVGHFVKATLAGPNWL